MTNSAAVPLPIARLFDAYAAAVLAKDVDALLALYDPDVRVFDLWGEWSYEGRGAWRLAVAGWFGSLGSERVAVGVDDVQTVVGHDVAVAHAFVTYRALSAGGEPLRAMQNRLTWALRQRAGAWAVVHEHTSAPIDFATTRAVLRR